MSQTMDATKFECWDPLSSEPKDADTIYAFSPLDAAERWAASDRAGKRDGSYIGGHPVAVSDGSGNVEVYEIAWVGHPERWHDRLSEGATLRATRRFDGPERDAYLRGDIPSPPLTSLRRELAEALGVDDETGVWFWPDLIAEVKRHHKIAISAKVMPGDVRDARVALSDFDRFMSVLDGWSSDPERSPNASSWYGPERRCIVAWDGHAGALAISINAIASWLGRPPHAVLEAIASGSGARA